MPVYQLSSEPIFPHPSEATADGLLAVGGDLSVKRLVMAYASGIFPWYSEFDPIMWWSPNPRLVLYPEKFRLSKSLKSKINKQVFDIKIDFAFEEVIKRCRKVHLASDDGTWISDEMIKAYADLHKQGLAHSIECWIENKLVGGLYGVSLGSAFFGESMFHQRTDASKVAFYYLCELAKVWNFDFIDCQVSNPHLLSLGAEEILRDEFLEKLEKSIANTTKQGVWMYKF